MAPKPPNVRSAPAEPWRSSKSHTSRGSERSGGAVALLYLYGAPDMAPKPPTFGAPRRSRDAPLSRTPRAVRSGPAEPGRSSKLWADDEAGVAAREVGGHRGRGQQIRDEHRRPGEEFYSRFSPSAAGGGVAARAGHPARTSRGTSRCRRRRASRHPRWPRRTRGRCAPPPCVQSTAGVKPARARPAAASRRAARRSIPPSGCRRGGERRAASG